MNTDLGPLLYSFFEDHLKCQKGLRPGSLKSYRDSLKLFLLFVAEKTGRPAPGQGSQAPAPARDPIRIGTAFYDRGRCLPWAMATDCIVCEEWCPTSPKAIYLVAVEVTDANGQTKTVKQPYVDPKRCTGCGACEFACPVKGRPAIYVTAAGESRSKANQFLLRENQPSARTSS